MVDRKLTGPAVAVIIVSLMILQTLLWSIPLFVAGFIKRIVPLPLVQRQTTRIITWIAESWLEVNLAIVNAILTPEWIFELPNGLRRDGSYLVISNHVAWTDILVLATAFNGRIPLTKYFVKQPIRYMPVVGFACWALDMPFMQRYSKEKLAKHPHLRGRDLETTRRSCAHFVGQPTTIVNFAEGTRFRPKKHAKQNPPYKHLLYPRAGGSALVLDILGPQLDTILHCTIIYPQKSASFWDFLCGRVARIVLKIEPEAPPERLLTLDYLNDETDRTTLQQWLNERWLKKDRLIEEIAPSI